MNKPIRPQIIPEQFARYEGQDVIPLKGREKRPLDNGWQRQSYDPARVIAKATKNNTNMGLRLGADDLVIDYDPRNDRTGDSFDRLVKDLGLEPSTFPTVNTGGGGQHYFLKMPPGVKITTTLAAYPGVEFKTKGTQVVAAGSVHPDTGRHYLWDDMLPPLEDAPDAPAPVVKAILRPLHDFKSSGGGIHSPAEVAAMLEPLDPADFSEHAKWFSLMCACHHASGGDAREEFVAWSWKDPEYDGDDTVGQRWDTLHAEKPGAVTVQTLYKALHDAGKGAAIPKPEITLEEFEIADPKYKTGGFGYDYFDSIKDKALEWLWKDRLLVGKLNLICGYAEKGKSQLTLSIAAAVTTGGEWPNAEGKAPKGAVIILSAEDDEEDTIKPRLKAAGADVSQCARVRSVLRLKEKGTEVIKLRLLNLYDDLDRLTITLENMRRDGRTVRLIIFDPINAYFGTKDNKTDSFKTSDMRAILTPLKEWAAKQRVAVLGITHFNKDSKGKNLLHRIVDSQAITAATRTVWACLESEETKQLIFARGKNNLGPQNTPTLAYAIVPATVELDDFEGPVNVSRVEWLGPVNMSAEQAMHGGTPGRKDADIVNDAGAFLEDYLAGGPKLAADVFKDGGKNGHTPYALRQAKSRLGVKAEKRGMADGWSWVLPKVADDFEDDPE